MNRALIAFGLVAAITAPALPSIAADPDDNVYQPVGAPADPKVAAQWNRYHDYAESAALLKELAAAYPDYAKLTSLGKSYEGREMWLLTVTDPEGDASRKPGMWIDGCIHANEIQGTEVVLYTAWYLLEARASSPFLQRLLKERVFYLFPILSPDAREAHFYAPNSTHSPRTGFVPLDDDRDGLVDEDDADDLDGDGNICQMRRLDPHGRFIDDSDYPGQIKRADDDKPGTYTLLGEEGIDNDGDGLVNEDGPGGYDPNRNWAWDWEPEYVQGGAHHYPFSLGENRLVADFVLAHPNIAGAQSYHNAAGMILHGPGNPARALSREDDRLLNAIADVGVQMLPGYENAVVHEDLYVVYGGEFDWLYGMNGILAFTNELWTSYNFFHTPSTEGWQGSRQDQKKFDKYLLFGDGFVPWHELEHPVYGKVEVGGWKKTWGRQPPSFLLEEECHRNMAFTLFHADQLPLVNIQSATAKPLGNGLTQVDVVVENPKRAPTRLGVDREHGISRSDWATLSGGKVIAATWGDDPFFQNPQQQEHHPERVELPSIPGLGARYVRWIVSGQGPLTVAVDSVKGGVVETAVK